MADVVHGVSVHDPYRWLEDAESMPTQQWVALQNARTRQALDARPDRGWWHGRLVALTSLPVVLAAEIRGDQLFVLERSPGAEQYALVLRSAADATAAPRTLVDPAASSADSATALDWFEPSCDGRLIAYGTSDAGSEHSTLAVLDVATGAHLADSIPDTRAASVAWLADSSGFYYTAYPAGDQYNRRVMFHLLGDDPALDEVIWSDASMPQSWPDVQASADGRFVLVTVSVGWTRVDGFVLDRVANTWSVAVAGTDQATSFSVMGDQLLMATTVDAPRGRVVMAALASPGIANWRTVVPEGTGVISHAAACGDEILVLVTERAVDRLERWLPDGRVAGGAPDFGIVSISGLTTDASSPTAFVTVAGFGSPAALYRCSGSADVVRWAPALAPDSSVPALTVRQVTYPSLDGTSVGLFLVHRSDVVPSTDTPTILTGYGGFAISETPVWSPTIAAWCANGGLYAIAGLRGGLEHGQEWHHAGRRDTKQNVFDDFHAAADFLVASGLTSRDRLAIAGGSNGGLLVGVALTQRPDLCAAVWCAVPLLDMVRFPRFLIAQMWTDEYGDPDVADEFAWLYAYSPYHHVSEGVDYPAVLLTTAESDTRVDPLHARKMAALLQWASASQEHRPILLTQQDRAGHGVGKPASKRVDEAADVLSFFSWQLGVPS